MKCITRAFTLIELLVVITIIVVLLALLVPALDKAIYQGELAVCASQLRGIGSAVTTYAMENKRYYPDRGLLNQAYNWDQPALLRYHPASAPARTVDQRVVLRKALPDLNKQLNDPLSGSLDIEGSEAQWIFSPYNLWWGFKYGPGTYAMAKIGERWDYRNQEFQVLASDRDIVRPQNREAQSSHSDHMHAGGVLDNVVLNDEVSPWLPGTITIALWHSGLDATFAGLTEQRGPVDDNFGMSDLSVQRFDRVRYDRDSRLRMVAVESNNAHPPGHYMYVP
jgi:prepilin-type N-terminal cleavage/methylation domain-containing protein